MSVLTMPAPKLSKQPTHVANPPTRKRWTVDEFHRLSEAGFLEDCRPMLINGEIYEMAIPGPPHNTATTLADYLLKSTFSQGFVVRVQMPLVLGQRSDPIPDIAVLSGSPRDYSRHPTTAVLVVEIADSSLSTDIGEKAQVYAAANIADYWVVDLNNRQLIVHRDPRPDPAAPMGASYSTVIPMTSGQSVSPLAQPTATINVSDLLP